MPMVAVLAYHKIGAPANGEYPTWFYVPSSTFNEQLMALLEAGWQPIDLDTFLRGLDASGVLPDRAVLITFDDGCQSLTGPALEVLRTHALPSVLFVPTGYVGQTNSFDAGVEPEEAICRWDDLRQLSNAGMSIQAHSVTHPRFSELEPERLSTELEESKRTIEHALGSSVRACAYPFGDAGRDPELVDATMTRLGYQAAFLYDGGLVDPRSASRFRLPRIPVGPDTDVVSELNALLAAAV